MARISHARLSGKTKGPAPVKRCRPKTGRFGSEVELHVIAARDQMLNAGVDINGFAPATLDELIDNNRRFKEEHACMTDGSA